MSISSPNHPPTIAGDVESPADDNGDIVHKRKRDDYNDDDIGLTMEDNNYERVNDDGNDVNKSTPEVKKPEVANGPTRDDSVPENETNDTICKDDVQLSTKDTDHGQKNSSTSIIASKDPLPKETTMHQLKS